MRNKTRSLMTLLALSFLGAGAAHARPEHHRGMKAEKRFTPDGWKAQIGGRGDERAADVVAAPGGGAYLVGTVERRGEQRGFVARVDARGDVRWREVVRGARGLALQQATYVESRGRLVVVGVEAIDGPRRRDAQLVAVAFSARGEQLWRAPVGRPARAIRAQDVASDARGNVYVVGDLTRGRRGRAEQDLFVTKLDRRGRVAWSHQLGARASRMAANPDSATAVAISPNGGMVHVLGVASGDLQRGFATPGSRSFELQLHPNGRVVRTTYGAPGARPLDLAFDARGDRWVVSATAGRRGGQTILRKLYREGGVAFAEPLGAQVQDAEIAVAGRRAYVGLRSAGGALSLLTFNRRGRMVDRDALQVPGATGALSLDVSARGQVFAAGSTFGELFGGRPSSGRDAFVVMSAGDRAAPAWLPPPAVRTAGTHPAPPRGRRRGHGGHRG